MKIKLSKLLDIISQETSIERKELNVVAWYQKPDESMSNLRNSSVEEMKSFLYEQFYCNFEDWKKYLTIMIKAKNCAILGFEINGIAPNRDVYKLIGIRVHQDCVGPGFYYSYPQFYIDKNNVNMENYHGFLNAVVLDTDKIENISFPENYVKSCFTKASDEEFLKSLEKTLDKSFFKNLPELEKKTTSSANAKPKVEKIKD